MLSLGDGLSVASTSSPKYFASIGGIAMDATEYGRWLNKLPHYYPGLNTDCSKSTQERIKIDQAIKDNPDWIVSNGFLPQVVERLTSRDIPTMLKQLSMPVMTINGMNDSLVPWYENISAYEENIPNGKDNCYIAWPGVNGILTESAAQPPFASLDYSSEKQFEPQQEVMNILYEWIERIK